jgi:hypothetical protein
MPLVLTWETAARAPSFTLVGVAGSTPLGATGINIPWLRNLLQSPVIDRLAAAAALVWAGGTFVLAVRFVGGCLLARRIAADAREAHDPGLESQVARAACIRPAAPTYATGGSDRA